MSTVRASTMGWMRPKPSSQKVEDDIPDMIHLYVDPCTMLRCMAAKRHVGPSSSRKYIYIYSILRTPKAAQIMKVAAMAAGSGVGKSPRLAGRLID